MLPPERVFAEMSALGLRATELGPLDYLPFDPERIRTALGEHELELVAAFVPLVLHRPREGYDAELERIIEVLAAAGAEVVVAALVTDREWSEPTHLGQGLWSQILLRLDEVAELVSERGLKLAVHPHAETVIERGDAIERLLAESEVGWCLDTGHLAIAGIDPARFAAEHAERIVHVHLKDVDLALAGEVGAHRLSLLEATRRGLFRPLGDGDAEIASVVRHLDAAGYRGWVVVEQDIAITGAEPAPGTGPVDDVRRSLEFLASRPVPEPNRRR
jgi:inosose dehydratase